MRGTKGGTRKHVFDGFEQDIEVKRLVQTDKIALLNFLVVSFKVGDGVNIVKPFEASDGVELIVEGKTGRWMYSVIKQKETWLDLLGKCECLTARCDYTSKMGDSLEESKLKECADIEVVLNHEDTASWWFPFENNTCLLKSHFKSLFTVMRSHVLMALLYHYCNEHTSSATNLGKK